MSEFESLNTIYERTHEGSAPQVGKRGAHNVTHVFRVYRAQLRDSPSSPSL